MLEDNRTNTDLESDIRVTDMGKVYDDFAEAFRKSDELPTWKYVGRPAMEKLLKPFLHSGVTFLDLGSASARVEVGVLLPNGVQAKDITGVEISPEQVDMAKARIAEADFIVGDVADESLLIGKPSTFDVVFSHMVFEHLSDIQLELACINAYRLLRPGGVFAFVVTHPDKMTDLDGELVKGYGAFETTAPWGGVLHNWRRSVEETVKMVCKAGFEVELTEEIGFPAEPPAGLDPQSLNIFAEHYEKYRKYPAIRLLVRATKPKH
jgi:SAM-dependent methyltransferase